MLFSGFAQDEFTLVPERLRLTGGVKLEHNDYTGLEVQPSGRLLWTPSSEHSFWAAISRAVRTPSRAEEDVTIHEVIPPMAALPASTIVTISGNRDFESETVVAYEVGYRLEPMKNISFDLAAFYNDYDHLRSQQPVGTATPPPPALFIPTQLQNGLRGETYGCELAANWRVTDWWRLRPSYSYLEMHLHKSAGDKDPNPDSFYEGTSPEQQCSLRSSMDLPWHLAFDATVRYVDELPALRIDSYVALDLRLGWRPHPNLEFAVVGQNLLSSHHGEFAPTFIGTPRTEIPQSVYAQVTWSFGGKH
jgi:iron complex outermembrane receptor protein